LGKFDKIAFFVDKLKLMELIIHEQTSGNIAELKSKELILSEVQDFLDLMGNANYLGAEKIIIAKSNLPNNFLDLKTKVAGEILQKFSTYNQKLAIIGDFSSYESKSLNDFIRESNKVERVLFISDKDEAIKRWSN
jgi:hypothetical protein